MSTFTGRELEFLAGLNKSWWSLYVRELARLCVHTGIAQMRRGDRVPSSPQPADADPAGLSHDRVELAVGNR